MVRFGVFFSVVLSRINLIWNEVKTVGYNVGGQEQTGRHEKWIKKKKSDDRWRKRKKEKGNNEVTFQILKFDKP